MSIREGSQVADLRGRSGAGDGNRTRMTSLEERRGRLVIPPDLGFPVVRGARR